VGKPEYDAGALERYVRGLADSTLVFAPGARAKYSNIGFEVLADLIAKQSGESFEDYMQRHILTPLGMRHSTFLMTDVDSANLARGHEKSLLGSVVVSSVYPYNRRHAGSLTLHSNIEDMLRWGAATVRGGELDGHRILSAANAARMVTVTFDRTADVAAQAKRAGVAMPYDSIGTGLSWTVAWMQGHDVITHSGGDTGFRSHLRVSRTDSTVIVLMVNNDAIGDIAELGKTITRILTASNTKGR
jgi:CubicO group peptidase (beta-lactamase class C family)